MNTNLVNYQNIKYDRCIQFTLKCIKHQYLLYKLEVQLQYIHSKTGNMKYRIKLESR